MKKIWKFLKSHIREDFNLTEYGLTAALLTCCIIVNYWLDFEDSILDEQSGPFKFFCYYLFFSLPYYLTLRFQRKAHPLNYWSDKRFWLRSQFALILLSLDSSVPYLHETIEANVPDALQYWTYKIVVNGISLFTVFIPLLLFYLYNDRQQHNMYGLSAKRVDVKPYFIMLMIMLPILISASFHKSFLRQYPMYSTSEAHIYFGVPDWVTALGYELAYGFDFITLELLFRGFFILGLAQLIGRRAVLAMAVIYCFLHFGKPAGEAVSSIFGGYILGVIALETRSVWGGIIVHLGIAWLMELVGFLQHSLR
jgi:hypothetical protein